jgi:hypothetical protein
LAYLSLCDSILVATLSEVEAMKKNENSIVDLGDARVETRGVGELGPLDIQTFQRTYNAGIQTDD